MTLKTIFPKGSLFYAKNPMKLRKRLIKYGIDEVNFRFDEEGTKVI